MKTEFDIVRDIIDSHKLWETVDAEDYNVGADHLARELVARYDNTVLKTDVEKMIHDWQLECCDHPALHNQGNVLLDRLKAITTSAFAGDA